jgi:hypothetical protein
MPIREDLRMQAQIEIARRLRNPQKWRVYAALNFITMHGTRDLFKSEVLRLLKTWKKQGEQTARIIAQARKAGPLSPRWKDVDSWDALEKNHPELHRRILECWDQFENERWKPVEFEQIPLKLGQNRYLHFLHRSVHDPLQVACYPTIRHLLENREVRMRPGKYLKTFQPHLNDSDVRNQVNQYTYSVSPTRLNFVENDDPDGWEWVYEQAEGFTSCMMYDKPDGEPRHLTKGLCGTDHPVRAYARPGNGLRLAWIGHGFGTPEGRVYARAIVRDYKTTEKRGYVRIYGDNSQIKDALADAGYKNSIELWGVELNRRDFGNSIICPYLDSGEIEIHPDHLEIVPDGISTEACGLISDDSVTCDACECRCPPDDLTYISDEGRSVCSRCLEAEYIWTKDGYYLHMDDTQLVEYQGDYYIRDKLGDWNLAICEDCGDVHSIEEMLPFENALYCSECLTSVDHPYKDYEKIPLSEEITFDDGTTACKRGYIFCQIKKVWMLESEGFTTPSRNYQFSFAALREYPERFKIFIQEDEFFYLVPATLELEFGNCRPLSDRDWSLVEIPNVRTSGEEGPARFKQALRDAFVQAQRDNFQLVA